MASLILGTVGSSLGGSVGGFIGSAIGAQIDAYLFSPDPPDVDGPRKDDTDFSAADPGQPIPITYGGNRVGSIVIHTTDIIETKYEREESINKKKYTITTYGYSITIDLLVGEGPILALGRWWADGKLIRGPREEFTADTQTDKFKVGGFPYPSYYFTRMYDPSLVPWHFDPDLAANADPGPYYYNTGTDQMEPASIQIAIFPYYFYEIFKDMFYWRDLDTGYYIPYANDFWDNYSYLNKVWPMREWEGEGFGVEYADLGEHVFDGTWGLLPDGSPFDPDIQNTSVNNGFFAFNFSRIHPFNSSASGLLPAYNISSDFFFPSNDNLVEFTVPIDAEELNSVNITSGAFLDKYRGYPEFYYSGPFGLVAEYFDGIGWDHIPWYNNPFYLYNLVTIRIGRAAASANPNLFSMFWTNRNTFIASTGGWPFAEEARQTWFSYKIPMDNDFMLPWRKERANNVYQVLADIDKGRYKWDTSFYFQCKYEPIIPFQNDPAPANYPFTFNPNLKVIAYNESGDQIIIYDETFPTLCDSATPLTTNYTRSGNIPPGTRTLEIRATSGKVGPAPIRTGVNGGNSGTYEPFDDILRSSEIFFVMEDFSVHGPDQGAFPVVRNWDYYYNLYAALNDYSPLGVLQFANPDGLEVYRGLSDQPNSPTMTAVAGEQVPAYRNRAHVVFDNFQLESFGNQVPQFSFEVIRQENEQIRTVIADLFLRAGVDGAYFDLTELPENVAPVTDPGGPPAWDENAFVLGYTLARRTSFGKAIEKINDAFFLDAAEVQTALKFRPSIRAADHTIDYNELAAHDADKRETDAQFTLNVRDKLSLPRVIEVLFLDVEREYQDNSARYYLKQTENTQQSSVDLAMVVYPWFAKAYSQRKLQNLWNGQASVGFTLPPKYIYVSPSDILEIVTDKQIGTSGGNPVFATFTVKVTSVRRGVNGLIEVEAVFWLGGLYPADDYDQIAHENNYIQFPFYRSARTTLAALLDIPPMTEDAVDDGTYVAFQDTGGTGWPGGQLWYIDPDTIEDRFAASSPLSCFFGNLRNPISIGTTPKPCTVELNNSFDVEVFSSNTQLPSYSIDDMFQLKGLLWVQGEIIAYTSAVDQGFNLWRISGPMIRGLKGQPLRNLTPAFEGIDVIEVDTEALATWEETLQWRNQFLRIKPFNIGVTDTSSTQGTFASTDTNRLRPLAPVMVTATRDGLNNATITWVRQDRRYATWPDNADIPNSEQVEQYQLDILDAPNGETIRTVTIDYNTSYTYTAALQTSDGLTPGDKINIRVQQISVLYGRGIPRKELV